MPRIVPLAAGTAAVSVQSLVVGPTARPVGALPYVLHALAILAGAARPCDGGLASARTSCSLGSPVPPANHGRRGERPTMKREAGRGPILRKDRTGSANNSWIPSLGFAKSLIIEATCLTNRVVFATNLAVFATSRIFRISPLSYTSLSLKLLKKKEKTEKKGSEQRTTGLPRVGALLPRVSDAAYFLGHEFYPLPRVNSWQLVEIFSFKFNGLNEKRAPSTNPRVALRVVRSLCLAARPRIVRTAAPASQAGFLFSKEPV